MRGLFDVAEIGCAVTERCGYCDDRDVEGCTCARFGRRKKSAGRQYCIQVLVGDVLDVGLAGEEPFYPNLVDVVRDDLVADLCGADRQRKAHVSLAHDYYAHHCTPR